MNVILIVAGIAVGAIIVFVINHFHKQDAKKIAQELMSNAESQKIQDLEVIINRMKESFGALSLDALSKNNEEFLKLANETLSKQTKTGEKTLENKKELIDQTLKTMKENLQRVQDVVTEFEKDRAKKFGELTSQIKSTAEGNEQLRKITEQLHSALASTKIRGQWGERMAEDVLRLAGFIEGVNYYKQKTQENIGTRPDYTFLLPQNFKVNMDVKFPLNNYLSYLEADNETEKEKHKKHFLDDVRKRIKEVKTRDYINPEDNTVNYVIVFIPNEQVYAFINENDREVLDKALENQVILCSPVTLYAILAVIRQAVDNFKSERSAQEMLRLISSFYKQWEAFVESLEKMGKKIDDVQKEFNNLNSTRRNQLEKPLRQIEDLRQQKGILEMQNMEIKVEDSEKAESPKKQNHLFV